MGAVKPTSDWQPHPAFPRVFVKPIVTRTTNPALTMNLVRVAPRAEITQHTHESSTETFYVLAGSGVSRIGDEQILLTPGVCGYAPPGVAHTVRNTGDVYLEAISIFNPPLP